MVIYKNQCTSLIRQIKSPGKELQMLLKLSTPCRIRHITTQVGAAVVHAAVAEDLAEGHGDVGLKELVHMSKVYQRYAFPILIFLFS